MRLENVFVESFPDSLEEGKLYVSMEYASVAHLCACGCGREVVTPLRKDAWRLEYDGQGITLSPSVGSRNLACRSHYYIREGKVQWLPKMDSVGWSNEAIASEHPEETLPPIKDRKLLEKWLGWLLFWSRQ